MSEELIPEVQEEPVPFVFVPVTNEVPEAVIQPVPTHVECIKNGETQVRPIDNAVPFEKYGAFMPVLNKREHYIVHPDGYIMVVDTAPAD